MDTNDVDILKLLKETRDILTFRHGRELNIPLVRKASEEIARLGGNHGLIGRALEPEATDNDFHRAVAEIMRLEGSIQPATKKRSVSWFN